MIFWFYDELRCRIVRKQKIRFVSEADFQRVRQYLRPAYVQAPLAIA